MKRAGGVSDYSASAGAGSYILCPYAREPTDARLFHINEIGRAIDVTERVHITPTHGDGQSVKQDTFFFVDCHPLPPVDSRNHAY
jgi:hypothetical protein